jgi:uncharacterized protein (TIRG00374 family)
MKSSSKRMWKKALNIAFILGTFIIVIHFALKSGDITQIIAALRGIHKGWLLGAIGCFALYAFFEGFITFVFLHSQKVKVSLSDNLNIALVGMYYSSITPAATGGQPVQIYCLKKRGVPTGISSSALTVKFFCWQCAVLLIGGFLWIAQPELVKSNMSGGGMAFLIVGFFINAFTVVLIVLLSISRNIVRAIVIFVVNIGEKMRLVKNKALTASRADAALEDFHVSVNLLTKSPGQFFLLLLLSICEALSLMSIIYFVYRGLGLNAHPYSDLLTMQAMLHIAASFTPLPGASGAQEGGFYLFFESFFPKSIIFAAMFVWRFITYYLSIICGFIAVLIDNTKKTPKKIKEQTT